MLASYIAISLGLIVMIWGADRCVTGASALARNLGVSPLVIGLTIVGFGTSAPEFLVSGLASWEGNPGLAVGNAIGSNIANIALVVGVTALVSPLIVSSKTVRREFPILLAVVLLAFILMVDGQLSQIDGMVLVAGLVAMVVWVVHLGLQGQKAGDDPVEQEYDDEIPKDMPMSKALLWLFVGLVLLLTSSKALVWGAVNVAESFGVSDLVIGLTIIAIGTSLPELTASVMSVLKKEDDLAIGNIIGSNMINILGVLALPGLIAAPAILDGEVMSRDFPFMAILTVVLLAMAFGRKGAGKITRLEGAMLLSAFIAYMVYLYLTAVS
ncbi:MAG: calcium/sodium antiporter [Gammaproteobacteria bacterium]|nr:calcium/sodium antiporter [Gammaproteobacteria bacterium]